MAFTRPTLTELRERITADFVTRLELTAAPLRRSMVYALARVIAGAAHMLHGHLEFLARQFFPDLSERSFLLRQGSLYGLTPTPATYATAMISPTGSGVPGASLPAGTVLTRSDGAEYVVASSWVLAGADDVVIRASLAGADYSLTIGDTLAFQSPITGIDATVAVWLAVDGTDEETTEAFRVRLLERLADPPHGGNEPDYVAWAKSVAGVTRVWVSSLGLGPGTVLVYFARDNDASPIPSAGEVADVQAVFDAQAPAHATVTAAAPTAVALNVTVGLTPDTAATRAAVEAEIVDLLARRGEPGGTIYLTEIVTAIGNAAGVTTFSFVSPAANVTHAAGEIPVMGTITYV